MEPKLDIAQQTTDALYQTERKVWQPLLADPLRGRALEAALLVAERLRQPEQVLAIAQSAAQQSRLPHIATVPPERSVFGFGGIAFPCAYFAQCFPDQGWDKTAHRYLNPQDLPYALYGPPSLFNMTSGMAMLLSLLSENGRRYHKTLLSLNKLICDQVAQSSWQPAGRAGRSEAEYDVISGATGTLAYLLTIVSPEDYICTAIDKILQYLIWLAGVDEESGLAHWYISQQFIIQEEVRQRHPDGYYNCGLAHGIPGPLAVLSLAWQAGYRTPGLREAIRFLSNWIVEQALIDSWGINWPTIVPIRATEHITPSRTAWCYGAPGIARALWLAAQALEDTLLAEVAIKAIEAVLRRPIAARSIDSPTICHGVAGLLEICLRFAHETESTTIREQIPVLVTQILDLYNPDFPLGFRDEEIPHNYVDQTAWLTGAPGVAMALLAASTPIEPIWDRALLLS